MARSRKAKTTTQHTVTAGSTIRLEVPKSGRQPKPNPVVVVAQEVNPVTGFVGFLREHAVVGLAIGFIIGLQAQAVVKSLVTSFIDPAFKLLFGQALALRTFTWHFHGRTSDFAWGAFVYGLANFLFVLLAIYLIVKFFNLDKLDKAEEHHKKRAKELK